jgi:hypothetical protein
MTKQLDIRINAHESVNKYFGPGSHSSYKAVAKIPRTVHNVHASDRQESVFGRLSSVRAFKSAAEPPLVPRSCYLMTWAERENPSQLKAAKFPRSGVPFVKGFDRSRRQKEPAAIAR